MKLTDEKKEIIIERLALGDSVVDACKFANTTPKQHRAWKRKDPIYQRAVEEAEETGNDKIDHEIQRRAIDGVLEPVFHDGKVAGRKRKYSDQLLLALAKSRMEKYREAQASTNITFDLSGAVEALTRKLDLIAHARPEIELSKESE